MPTSRAIAEYHDFWAYVLLSAPDNFPQEDYLQPAEQMTLEKAFVKLIGELEAVWPRVKDHDQMHLLQELLTMALESYREGNDMRGAHILQEFEGLIWPKYKQPEQYAPEARARVAGRSGA